MHDFSNDFEPIPKNSLVLITENEIFDESAKKIVTSLKGNIKRDWMTQHSYNCLPLIIGNQYGFAIRSLYDVFIEYNGGIDPSSIKVTYDDSEFPQHQIFESKFGSGILTIQNRFQIRTSKGVNIMTFNPPNFLNSSYNNLTGVIETDNLRRDFTFNIKINHNLVHIKKGEYVSCFIPIPRFYIDDYNVVLGNEILDETVLIEERIMNRKFALERAISDKEKKNNLGKRYLKGEDADGKKFYNHQTKL